MMLTKNDVRRLVMEAFADLREPLARRALVHREVYIEAAWQAVQRAVGLPPVQPVVSPLAPAPSRLTKEADMDDFDEILMGDLPPDVEEVGLLLPPGVDTEDLTFTIRKSDVDEIMQKAASLGVAVAISPPDTVRLASSIYGDAAADYQRVHGHQHGDVARALFQQMRRDAEERAAKIAEGYVTITATYPKTDYPVIATAEKVGARPDGRPLAKLLERHTGDYWTGDRIASLDFTRCDKCGVRHHRKLVYIVDHPREGVWQVGGACADQLALGPQIRAIFKGMKDLAELMKERADGDGAVMGGRGFRYVNVKTLLVLIDFMISTEGYLSSTAAQRKGIGWQRTTAARARSLYNAPSAATWPVGDREVSVDYIFKHYVGPAYVNGRADWLYRTVEQMIYDRLEEAERSTDNNEKRNAYNAEVAFLTGTMVGYLAYAVFAVTNNAEAYRALSERGQPWSTSVNGAPMSWGEANAWLAEADGRPVVDLWRYIGGLTPTQVAKADKAPDKGLATKLAEKFVKFPVGPWEVMSQWSFSGMYGLQSYAVLVQPAGFGALGAFMQATDAPLFMLLSGSAADNLNAGSVVRFTSTATVVDVQPAKFDKYRNMNLPAMPKVNRTAVEVTDEPALIASGPPRPVLPIR